jgi:hypothetical protein
MVPSQRCSAINLPLLPGHDAVPHSFIAILCQLAVNLGDGLPRTSHSLVNVYHIPQDILRAIISLVRVVSSSSL